MDAEPEVTAADVRFKGPGTGWTTGNTGVKLDVEGPITTPVLCLTSSGQAGASHLWSDASAESRLSLHRHDYAMEEVEEEVKPG